MMVSTLPLTYLDALPLVMHCFWQRSLLWSCCGSELLMMKHVLVLFFVSDCDSRFKIEFVQ